MGRKINPIGFRLAVNHNWSSQWFVRKQYFADCVYQDYKIRQLILKQYASAMISGIEITRLDNPMDLPNVHSVKISAARPGVIIGNKGEEIDNLRKQISYISKTPKPLVDVKETTDPEANASLTAQNIANRLEKRQRSRRVIQSVLQALIRQPGVLGAKICAKGRLEGADIARKDYRHEGRVPLHTLRANIDYGFAEAHTQMGRIGIKVWIFRGEQPYRQKQHKDTLELIDKATSKEAQRPVPSKHKSAPEFDEEITEGYETDVEADKGKENASS